MRLQGDHPRRCGENGGGARGEGVYRGSPPQVRGKRWGSLRLQAASRITPAGAGKTSFVVCVLRYGQDHPRRCGENWDTSCCIIAADGSPPQDRPRFRFPRTCGGDPIGADNTPAGAGKTQFHRDPAACIRDHPRRCGENREIHDEWDGEPGSPPQVRGKRLPPLVSIATGRITPAGAGKTLPFCNISFSLRDHPRRCGENRRLG